MTLTHGALFQGIGGFSLAARNVGIPTLWESEIDKYCQLLSMKNFPEIKTRYHDIREMINDKNKIDPVSIISGGFPCQPFSTAGKRKGTEDNRYLWPQTIEVIKKVRPDWCIFENVPGIINMELGNIIVDLEGAGYRLPETTQREKIIFLIPAISVGAPHIRKRVWIIAYNDSLDNDNSRLRRLEVLQREASGIRETIPHGTGEHDRRGITEESQGQVQQPGERGESRDISNTKPERLEGTARQRMEKTKVSTSSSPNNADSICQRLQRPTRARVGSIREEEKQQERCASERTPTAGRSHWAVEPGVGRVANGVPSRVAKLRGLGNAIVPQVAEIFFRIIKEIELDNTE